VIDRDHALAEALADYDDRLRDGSTVVEPEKSRQLPEPDRHRFQKLSPLLANLRCLPRPASTVGSLLRLHAELEHLVAAEGKSPREQPVVSGYHVHEEIGRGGMGVVYRATQLSLNRIVALKILRDRFLTDEPGIERFRKEAEIAASLRHPNIVQIYDVRPHGGHWHIAAEYVPGGSLADRLRDNTLAPREAAALVAAIADAVQAAHDAGIIHRDVKAANILMDGPIPKLADFGLARRLAADGLTATGAIVGTPNTMSPEQARGEDAVGAAADVYGLGTVLYECLTGQPPFRGRTPMDVVRQVLECEPVALRTLAPGTPRDLETIVMTAMQKVPAKRYASAALLAEDLRRFLDGHPIRARRTPIAIRLLRRARRSPAITALAAALLLAIVAGVASAVRFTDRLQTSQRETAAERDKALEQSRLARAAVQAFLHQVTNDSDFRAASSPQLRRRLLDQARAYYDTLPPAEDDPQRLNERIALLLDFSSLSSLLGDASQAADTIREAAMLADRLAADSVQSPTSRISVANAWTALGLKRAEAGDFTGAARAHRDAIALLEATLDQAGDRDMHRFSLAACHNNHGLALRRAGDLDGAESAHREALRWRETLPQHVAGFANAVAQSHHNLASVYQSRKRYDEAMINYRKAAALREAIVLKSPRHPEYLLALSVSLESAARIDKARGRPDRAREDYEKALRFLIDFNSSQPGVSSVQDAIQRVQQQLSTLESP
jgi:tetratricopeptide (TPR) repeat protein/tRNA A-37 threonylcarbamoyl transferase component Bud32